MQKRKNKNKKRPLLYVVTGKLKIKKRKNPKMENVIEIKNLVKSIGEVKAVNDLSFKVKEGELFAFLGVNGAGKSTTISIMCGASETDVTAIMNGIKEGIDCKLSFSVPRYPFPQWR